jgi:DHA1 family multidrug resistance protein-like MFS transporter
MSIRRALWIFAAVSLLTSVSDRILFVVFPNFLLDRSFSATDVGLVFSAASGVLLLSRTLVGKLSDRLGRKRLLSGGLLVQSLSMGLFPLASRLGEFVAIRAAHDAGDTMATSVKDAMEGDAFPPKERPRAFARVGAMVPLGRGLATIIGFLVVTYLSLEVGFWVAALFMGMAFLVIALFYREPRKPSESMRIGLTLSRYSRRFKILMAVWFVVSVNYTVSYYPAFFVLARDLGITEGLLFLLLLAGNLVSTVLSYTSDGWMNRYGRGRVMAFSLLGFSVLTLSYAFASSVILFFLMLLGVSVFYYVWRVAFKVVMIDSTDEGLRGEQMGLAKTVQGAGDIIGPLLGGFLIDAVSLGSAFLAAGIVGVAGFFVALLAGRAPAGKLIKTA